jgi:hypothetical protein
LFEGRDGVIVELPLDQFFTPGAVARRVVEATDVESIASCLDSGCGGGDLLQACEAVFPDVQCFGIDKDPTAVAALKQRYPAWRIATADILRPIAARRSSIWRDAVGSDCILINPPFSMGGTKGIWVSFEDRMFRCSVAMGHLLTTLNVFQPRGGGAAVVPESMMYSEVDEAARTALSAKYSLEIVEGLKNCTFRGARANALIVRIRSRGGEAGEGNKRPASVSRTKPEIVRGGLPLFEARSRGPNQLPLVHTTDLPGLRLNARSVRSLRRVRRIERGVVKGPVLLIPRVGVPCSAVTQAIDLLSEVQLSDCVIALRFASMRSAETYGREMLERWERFLRIYRGTGARYTTVRSLTEWCESVRMRSGRYPRL